MSNLPKEGTKVRLVGLKNLELNGKKGTISSYSRDGERVMVTLIDGPQGLVKVKPKQIQVIEGGGGGRPGMQRGGSSRKNGRGASQDSRGLHRSTNGGSQRSFNVSGTSLRRGGGDNASQSSEAQEIVETLRSADAMFDLADTSGDGFISQKEFEFYMRKHTNHDDDMIRECFYMIDVDHNGDISRDEVRNAFLKKRRELKGGGSLSESKRKFEDDMLEVSRDADRLFKEADIDGNGHISIGEFELYMKRHTAHPDRVIHELFDSMDVDKDGFITREEVRKAYLQQKKGGATETLAELLGVDDDEMAEIEDDVYNMFFLSDYCSQSFWFAIIVFLLKLGLIMLIALDLFTVGSFPEYTPPLVKTTQFLLLPVNVSVQEELITTFFIYANLKWSKTILELNPGASRTKYHIANLMRFVDGIAFLFINTTLLLQAELVISAFLNFAALQFLSSIDNVALHLARDGYLTENLETVAGNVLLFKLPRNHNEKLQMMDSALLLTVFLLQLIAWILLIFVL